MAARFCASRVIGGHTRFGPPVCSFWFSSKDGFPGVTFAGSRYASMRKDAVSAAADSGMGGWYVSRRPTSCSFSGTSSNAHSILRLRARRAASASSTSSFDTTPLDTDTCLAALASARRVLPVFVLPMFSQYETPPVPPSSSASSRLTPHSLFTGVIWNKNHAPAAAAYTSGWW